MTDDLYYRKLESTSTSDLVDMLREKDRRIEELEQENAGLKAGKDMTEADLATIAYMQGAERYKTKWHDLRVNPNDLPKHSGLYCVQCGEVREYVKEERSWFTVHFEPCMNRTEDTYLWCEIPKYK